jgi:hypothetical protein
MNISISAEPLKVALVPQSDMIGYGEISKSGSFIGVSEFGVLYKYLEAENEMSDYVSKRVLPVIDFKDISLVEALAFIESYVNNQRQNHEEKQPVTYFRCELDSLKSKKVSVNLKNATLSQVLKSLADQAGGKLAISPFAVKIIDQ